MVDKNQFGCGRGNELCCINVNKIFDSARDKECLEDLRVYLNGEAQEMLDHSSSVRAKNVEVIATNIHLENVPFNRGFYQVNVRFFFCVTLEACVFNGMVKELQGLAVHDKKIILFGSEKNVSVFTSDPEQNTFCPSYDELKCNSQSTLPVAVVEVAQPMCLDAKIVERHRPFGNCCCGVDSVPDNVVEKFGTPFVDGIGNNRLFVTIGMFTVVRLERPVQLLVQANGYCIPDKDSTPANCHNDPCDIFGKLNFPFGEFFPYALNPNGENRDGDGGCREVKKDHSCGGR